MPDVNAARKSRMSPLFLIRGAAAQARGGGLAVPARPADHATGTRARVLTVLEHLHPVDQHVGYTSGVALRRIESRMIDDRRRVEHDDVGMASRIDAPTPLQLPIGGRQPGQAAYRLGKADDLLLADVSAEEPCEGTVRARMIAGLEERALGRGGLGVGTEADPGLRDH